MIFFSGFSLRNEEHLFSEYILKSDYCVSGFSYGAIKAFKYAKEQLSHGKRIDTLQFFSPAFFQTKDIKFKRMQLMGYRKNKEFYLNQFIDSCFLPYGKKDVELCESVVDELDELLNFEWSLSELVSLTEKGLKIEVYLGAEDKIIDVEATMEFFLQCATVTYIKDANHFLQTT